MGGVRLRNIVGRPRSNVLGARAKSRAVAGAEYPWTSDSLRDGSTPIREICSGEIMEVGYALPRSP